MLRAGRLEDPAFEATEALYRRCHPEDVHEYEAGKFRIVTTAWGALHNISTVRGKYAQPDHARWDSATDPQNPEGFEPQLYRDWYVVRLLIRDIPTTLSSSGDITYGFAPAHVPFEDLYSHSEIRASKDGARIVKQNKFKSEEVKGQYRGVLSNAALVVLKPDEIEVAPAVPAEQRVAAPAIAQGGGSPAPEAPADE